MAQHLGIEICIIPNGYAGLYNLIDLTPIIIDENRVDKIHSVLPALKLVIQG
jgi:hypothetical protein